MKFIFIITFLSFSILFADENSNRLSLNHSVSILLKNSNHLKSIKRTEEITYARYLQQKSIYNFTLNGRAAGNRDYNPSDSSPTVNSLSYGVGFSKTIRSGILFDGSLNMIHSQTFLQEDEFHSRTPSLELSTRLPLLTSWRPSIAAGYETASRIEFEATTYESFELVSLKLVELISLYWNYVANLEHLRILNENQEMTEKLIEDIRELIRLEKKPESDIIPFLANLSNIKLSKKSVQKSTYNIRRDILNLLEIDFENSDFNPSTPLVFFDFQELNIEKTKDYFIKNAMEYRGLLIADKKKLSALKSRLKTSQDLTNDNFDLTISSKAFKNYLSEDTDEYAYSVNGTLSYDFSFEKKRSEGVYAENLALYHKQLIEKAITEKEVRKNIISKIDSLKFLSSMIAERKNEISLYNKSLENEKEKFKLGNSTVIDILNTENLLLQARLKSISDRLDFAVKFTELQFESGMLIRKERDRFVFNVESITDVNNGFLIYGK